MQMEEILNFTAGGLMGDFINSLYAAKNLCEIHNKKANIYLNNAGEGFRYGIQKAYDDLYELVINQPYINDFQVEIKETENSIKLHSWRNQAHSEFNNGGYKSSWSEIFSQHYSFNIPKEYKWIYLDEFNEEYRDCVLIHRSNRRINPKYDYSQLIDECNKYNQNVCFLICDETDLYIDGYAKYSPKNIKEMAVIINSCRYFVGNQSAPLALASSLDKQRLAVLDLDFNNYMFYKNEINYSTNIKCFID
jgi:ADP-heptose:LPS heptosyltransferase